MYVKESIKIFEMEIMRYLESENLIFRSWLVCMFVHVNFVSITHKQVTAEASNLLLCICTICRCYKHFSWDRTKTLCIGFIGETLRYLKSENLIFRSWLVCMSVCVNFVSITHKQVTAEVSNLLLCICTICTCY